MVKPDVKKIEVFGHCSDLNRVENSVPVTHTYIQIKQLRNVNQASYCTKNQINLQTRDAVINIENLYQKKRASCYLLIY